jgi:hypothetical protein
MEGGIPKGVNALVDAAAHRCRYLDDGEEISEILDDPRPTLFGFYEEGPNRTKEEERTNQKFCALAAHAPDMNIVLGNSAIAEMFAAPVPSIALLYAPGDINKVGQTLPTAIGSRGVLRVNGDLALNTTFLAGTVLKRKRICKRATKISDFTELFRQDGVAVILHIDDKLEDSTERTSMFCSLGPQFPAVKLLVSNDAALDRVMGVVKRPSFTIVKQLGSVNFVEHQVDKHNRGVNITHFNGDRMVIRTYARRFDNDANAVEILPEELLNPDELGLPVVTPTSETTPTQVGAT